MASFSRWGARPAGRGGGAGSYHVFGLFVPKPIAWLIVAIVSMTAVGALLERNGIPVVTYSVLVPGWVVGGQAWRLFTWALREPEALNLVFGCLLLYWLGPDLLAQWGRRRFFLLYFVGAAVVGAVTCLVGLVWSEVYAGAYQSIWPMIDAFIISWAAAGSHRQIAVFLVLPMSGRHLVAFTIALTFIYALMYGFAPFVPHFVAEILALVYADVFSLRRLYLRGRMAMLQHDYKRRTAHLRMVDRDDEKPPRWMH